MVPLKYLNNFWRTLKMPLINSEINFILTLSASLAISNTAANQATTFAKMIKTQQTFVLMKTS